LAQKRVLLAKTMKLDEIKGRTVQEVITRIVSDLKQKIQDREDNKDTNDGLEDVLRAEEQIRRLVGDSEFEELGGVQKGSFQVALLLKELKKLAHAEDSGAYTMASRQGHGDQRQNAFERMMKELRHLDQAQSGPGGAADFRQAALEARMAAFERLERGMRKRAVDRVQARTGAPWNSKPAAAAPPMSIRERQRLALDSHLLQQRAAAAALRPLDRHAGAMASARQALSARGHSSSPADHGSPPPRRPETSQGALPGENASGATGSGGEKSGLRSRTRSVAGASKGKGLGGVLPGDADRGEKGTARGGGHLRDKDKDKVKDKDDIIIIPGAPTPKEMLQVVE